SIHPALRGEAVLFEDCVSGLARETDRVLRKHGSEITAKQFVQRRIADVAIDIYAVAAALARTSALIERRGGEGARRELDLATGFAQLAMRRLHQHLEPMERAEDELLKQIAQAAFDAAGPPFDELPRGGALHASCPSGAASPSPWRWPPWAARSSAIP